MNTKITEDVIEDAFEHYGDAAYPHELQRQREQVGEAVADGYFNKLCDLFSIGSKGRNEWILLVNVKNALRRSDCLSAIERQFFTYKVPDEEFGGEAYECDLPWGAEPEEYKLAFAKVLEKATPPPPPSNRELLEKARVDALNEAADLAVQWGNARKDKFGGNALRNYAEAIRALMPKEEGKS